MAAIARRSATPIPHARAHFYAVLSRAIAPRPITTVSSWADKYRILTSKSSGEVGQWRTDRTPYLREVMDSYGPNATTLMVYNICNMPGETDADFAEFVATVSQADPKYRVILVLQSTPFRPSLATPMQWEAVAIQPDWSKLRAQAIIDRPNLRVVHSFTLETPWSHLRSVIVERATVEDDAAIHAIAFSPKLAAARSDKALALFARNFDVSRWTAERDIDGPAPAPFLSGYLPDATIRKIATKMRAQRAAGLIPGKRVIQIAPQSGQQQVAQ